MIVTLTLAPDEQMTPEDTQDIGRTLTALGFQVDLVHTTKQRAIELYEGSISQHSAPAARNWRENYDKRNR